MDKKDGGTIDLESLRGFTPGPHPDAQPAPDECFCDRMYPDSNPNASCGDCPTRDYAPNPTPAHAADGAGELPPLPPVDGYDKRVAGHYSAASMHAYALAAIAALRQPVPDAVRQLPAKWRSQGYYGNAAGVSLAYWTCATELESALAAQQESRNAD